MKERQQREREPFKEEDIAVIRDKHLKHQCSDYEEQRHEMTIETRDELRDFSHGCDVGGDIESIGDQQQKHDALEYRWRECGLDVGGKPFSSDPPDARAHRLDRRHEGEGQRHRPQHVETELRTRLGIGGYPARIIVGHAGDKPWSDPRQRMLFQAGPQDPEGLRTRRYLEVVWAERHALHFRLVGNKD